MKIEDNKMDNLIKRLETCAMNYTSGGYDLMGELLQEAAEALTAFRVSAEEDFATFLSLSDTHPHQLQRVAAFLRLYAGRIRQNERWDVPETMARTYESAARALDAIYAEWTSAPVAPEEQKDKKE